MWLNQKNSCLPQSSYHGILRLFGKLLPVKHIIYELFWYCGWYLHLFIFMAEYGWNTAAYEQGSIQAQCYSYSPGRFREHQCENGTGLGHNEGLSGATAASALFCCVLGCPLQPKGIELVRFSLIFCLPLYCLDKSLCLINTCF